MKLCLIRVAFALSAFAVTSPTFPAQGNSATSPHPTTVMMERMTTAEIRDAIHAGKTIVLIPSASTDSTTWISMASVAPVLSSAPVPHSPSRLSSSPPRIPSPLKKNLPSNSFEHF